MTHRNDHLQALPPDSRHQPAAAGRHAAPRPPVDRRQYRRRWVVTFTAAVVVLGSAAGWATAAGASQGAPGSSCVTLPGPDQGNP